MTRPAPYTADQLDRFLALARTGRPTVDLAIAWHADGVPVRVTRALRAAADDALIAELLADPAARLAVEGDALARFGAPVHGPELPPAPRRGMRFVHSRNRDPQPGTPVRDAPRTICRVTSATSRDVYFRLGDDDGPATTVVDRDRFPHSVHEYLDPA